MITKKLTIEVTLEAEEDAGDETNWQLKQVVCDGVTRDLEGGMYGIARCNDLFINEVMGVSLEVAEL